MNSWASWLLPCMLLLAGCGKEEMVPLAGPAVLLLDKRQADLGEVAYGEPHFADFTIRNAGGSELHISHLRSSCGCSSVQLTRSRIPAGETAMLRVTTKPDRRGEHSAVVSIQSNSEGGDLHEVRVRWNALSGLEIAPQVIDFGTVKKGEELQGKFVVTLRPGMLKEKRPVRVRQIPPFYQAVQSDIPPELSGGSTSIPVHVKAGDTPGEQVGHLVLQLTGGWTETVDLVFRWKILETVIAIPRRLSLGQGRPGERVEGRIQLRAPIGELKISAIELTGQDWTAEQMIPEGSETTVTIVVRGRLPKTTGVHQAKLHIRHQLPEPGELLIPVSAVVLDPGESS